MGKCGNCNKHVGIFFNKYRMLGGAKICLKCVPIVIECRRIGTLRKIQEKVKPTTLLVLPVISRDLDFPGNVRRYVGVVLFTDKGIIFAQFGEWKISEGAGAFGVLGGPVGLAAVVVYGMIDSNHKKGALVKARENSAGKDPMALINDAKQLFFVPLEQISKLEYNKKYCKVKMGKMTWWLRWADGKKTVAPIKGHLDAYTKAANSRQNVLLACQHAH